MGLKRYLSKRNFKKTSEPKSARKSPNGPLRFCVQKHAARHLHYDFRLEYRGVLLSWAIPKGPSLNPQDKRLAIKVEDHPLDYQYFEGIIPKGNYGAGTVEIWDHGTYTIPESQDRGEIEKNLTKGLQEGHLVIILKGERLNGEFIFQKLKKSDPDDSAWLLIKKNDPFSSARQMKTESSAKKDKMPGFTPPMLATLIDQPFDDENWLFEIKWDGFRALAYVNKGKAKLLSRNDHPYHQFPSIVSDLEKIAGQVILDGEIVVLNSEGKSDFQLMQNYQKKNSGSLYYYVFDLLYQDGQDLREIPLIERKERLKKLIKDLSLPAIRYSDHVVKKGKAYFQAAVKAHLEGIIAKKINSVYEPRRSKDWLKIKALMRQEVVIGGFTTPRGSRKQFGALLIGVYQGKDLIYAGHVGGGFDNTLLHTLAAKLKPLIQKQSPFKNPPKPNMPATWVKPHLVCEVKFAEWTQDNIMRQPIFLGLRSDKKSKEVKREMPNDLPTKKEKIATSSLTHLEKVYWPKEKYTKGDLIEYYTNISPFILPYLKDRAIVLHRYPNGIEGKEFYQKDLDFSLPSGIKTFPINHEGKIDHYLLIQDLQSLLFAINLGSIDLHPFISRCRKLDFPDYCIIDLDPQNISFDHVIEVALAFHAFLDEMGIKHYCKTSGKEGLHICIPFHAKYDYDQSRQFAEIICRYVYQKLPKITSLERSPKKRDKKIYLDYLQNRSGQTLVAPYSVRPVPKALVSTPLEWKEVNDKLDISKFTMKNTLERVKKKGDLFKGILGPGVNLKNVLSKLKKSLKSS